MTKVIDVVSLVRLTCHYKSGFQMQYQIENLNKYYNYKTNTANHTY